MVKKVGKLIDANEKKKKDKKKIKIIFEEEKNTDGKNYPLIEGQTLLEILMKLLSSLLNINRKDLMLPKFQFLVTHASIEAKKAQERINSIIFDQKKENKVRELKDFVSKLQPLRTLKKEEQEKIAQELVATLQL